MKNIVSFSFLLLVFANLSFAQTLQDKREAIFDKAQFEIFCQTIKHISENGKKDNSWYPTAICEPKKPKKPNISNIYKYLGHKEQGVIGGKGNATSLYTALKAAKGKSEANGKDIAKDSKAITTIITNLKTQLKKQKEDYVKNFDSVLLPKLNKTLADAVKEAKAITEEETSSLGRNEPKINQNENPRKGSQLDASGTNKTGEKDIITRLKNLEAQNSLHKYWHFGLGLTCVILLLLIIIIFFKGSKKVEKPVGISAEFTKYLEQINGKIDSLPENFTSQPFDSTEDIKKVNTSLKQINGKIDSLPKDFKKQISDFKEDIEKVNTSLEQINGKIDSLPENFKKDIEKINTSSEQIKQDQKNPSNKDSEEVTTSTNSNIKEKFFVYPPYKNGIFKNEKLKYTASETPYELYIYTEPDSKNNDGEFEFVNDKESYSCFINTFDKCIKPICEETNIRDQSTNIIITTQRGKIRKEGNIWKVTKKAKIRYE